MKIKFSYVSYIKVSNIKNNTIINLEKPITIKQLIDQLEIKGDVERFIIPIVNDRKEEMNYILKDGDNVFLYLPVEGG